MAKIPGLVDGSGGGVLDSLRSASYLNPAVRRPAPALAKPVLATHGSCLLRDAYVADATKELQNG